MSNKAITERCELVLVGCLDDVLTEGRAADLANRLDVVTKATRYLETVTPRLTFVRHIHDPQEVADPLAKPLTDPDPTGGLRE